MKCGTREDVNLLLHLVRNGWTWFLERERDHGVRRHYQGILRDIAEVQKIHEHMVDYGGKMDGMTVRALGYAEQERDPIT